MGDILLKIFNTSIMLFIIIDFLGSVPIFVGLLKNMNKVEKRKIINLAIVVSFIILVFFSILGIQIFNLFGVSIVEFKIAGGILLLMISLDEVFNILPQKEANLEDIGIVPIASPLIAGPGAITTAIIAIQGMSFPTNYLVVIISIILVLFVIWILFINIEYLHKILGRKGCLVLSRIMGIVLMAISISFIAGGIRQVMR